MYSAIGNRKSIWTRKIKPQQISSFYVVYNLTVIPIIKDNIAIEIGNLFAFPKSIGDEFTQPYKYGSKVSIML